MSDRPRPTREVQFGHDGRLYELDGTLFSTISLDPETVARIFTDPATGRTRTLAQVRAERHTQPPPAAAGAGFVSPPVVACEDVDLDAVEQDALTHYYVSGGTVLGLVEMCRERGAEAERLKRENTGRQLSMCMIKKSLDRLFQAVQEGVYDARSSIGDEVLNMLHEYEGHKETEDSLCDEVERLKDVEEKYELMMSHLGDFMKARQQEWRETHGLEREVARIKTAVQLHHDQEGDDRCHLDDLKLYHDVLGVNPDPYETALPPKCDFLASCERFWRQRQAPFEHGTSPMPGDMTIAQLQAEVERLKGLVYAAPPTGGPRGEGMTWEREAGLLAAEVARLRSRLASAPDLEAAIRDAVDDLPHRAEVMIHVSRDGAEAHWRTDAEWHEAESPDGLAAEVREAVERCKHGPEDEDADEDLPEDADAPAPSWPDRLRFDLDVSGESPVVVGTRVTAAKVVNMIVDGYTWAGVLGLHPELTEDDIRACFAYTVEHGGDIGPAKLALEWGNATPGPSPGAKADWVVTVRRTLVEKLHCPDCTREEAAGDPIGRSSSVEEVEGSETVEVLGVARGTEADS